MVDVETYLIFGVVFTIIELLLWYNSKVFSEQPFKWKILIFISVVTTCMLIWPYVVFKHFYDVVERKFNNTDLL